MIIQACLNGARPRDYHPQLPIAPGQLARDGAACVAAGASELHIHPRDLAGRETLDAEALGQTVSALRGACPGTSLGVSTGEWIEGSLDRTLAAIASWRELPDYTSVNLFEDGAPLVMEALWRRGIGVEAGLGTAADAERLLDHKASAGIFRVLIEIEEQDEARPLQHRTRLNQSFRRPRLVHGFGEAVWPLVDYAFRRRFSTRVGLEDGDKLPDGTTTSGNEDLVRAAVKRLKAVHLVSG